MLPPFSLASSVLSDLQLYNNINTCFVKQEVRLPVCLSTFVTCNREKCGKK